VISGESRRLDRGGSESQPSRSRTFALTSRGKPQPMAYTVVVAPWDSNAETRFRDGDGRIRRVERRGPTRSAASRALRLPVRDRIHVDSSSRLSGESNLRDLAQVYLNDIKSSDRSPSTIAPYEDRLNQQILPVLADVRLRETCGSSRVALRAPGDENGLAAQPHKFEGNLPRYVICVGTVGRPHRVILPSRRVEGPTPRRWHTNRTEPRPVDDLGVAVVVCRLSPLRVLAEPDAPYCRVDLRR
jgi:hypothetical protein